MIEKDRQAIEHHNSEFLLPVNAAIPRRLNVLDSLQGKPALARRVENLPPLSRATGTPDDTVRDRLRMLAGVDEGVGMLLEELSQSQQLNTTFCVDVRNPYVYAHTSPNFMRLVDRVGHIAAVHPDGDDMLINVYNPDGDCWPLPWYLRRYPRVNYYPKDFDAGMVLTRAEYEETVAAQLAASSGG